MKEFYKLIALASPEAGAGRSVCAASIAIGLAQRARCLALDLDAQTHNLQTYLGLPSSRLGIAEFLEEYITSLNTIRAETSIANLDCMGWSTSTEESFQFGTQGIASLLQGLHACKAGYVIAALPRGMDDDTIELFSAADFPIVVTHPSPEALAKVVQFLSRCKSQRFEGRTIHVLVNRVQRSNEGKDAEVAIKAAGNNLGLSVSILGTIPYDPQLEAAFRPGLRYSPQRSPGVSATTFENIVTRIEPLPARPPQVAASPAAAQVLKQTHQTDEAIRRLQAEHRAVVEELQAKLKGRDAQLAESAAVIHKLEADLMRRNQESSKGIVHRDDTEVARGSVAVDPPVLSKAVTKKTSYVVPAAATGIVILAILAATLIQGRRREEIQQVRTPQVNSTLQQPSGDAAPAPAPLAAPEPAPVKATVARAPVPTAPSPKPTRRERTTAPITAASAVNSSVVHRVLPEIPAKARNRIRGTVRITVRVATDPSGSVTSATLDSRGSSQYFADLSLQAARNWKFAPSGVDGQNVPAEWLLRFQFDRKTTNVAVAKYSSPH